MRSSKFAEIREAVIFSFENETDETKNKVFDFCRIFDKLFKVMMKVVKDSSIIVEFGNIFRVEHVGIAAHDIREQVGRMFVAEDHDVE
mgnify:CR=1 FL=1